MMSRKLFALAMLVVLCGCGMHDSYAKYTNVQLKVGMSIDEIKQQFGEPDSYNAGADDVSLGYGPFGVYIQRGGFSGEITRYRLDLKFQNGRLVSWQKNVPRQKGTD